MTTITDFQIIYETSYKAIYTSLKNAYQEFKEDKTTADELKIWNQFLLKIAFVRDYELLCWKEPHDLDAAQFTCLKNPFKLELKENFEFKEVEYPSDCINNFVKYDIPKLRTFHIQQLESGHRDYQWDNDFIHKATDTDIIKLLAKYYAYGDFMNRTHPHFIKKEAAQQRGKVDDKFKAYAKWTGDSVEEFVRLFSSLYESGLIQDMDGVGKIKMIKELAKYFDITLGATWQIYLTDDLTDGNLYADTSSLEPLEE